AAIAVAAARTAAGEGAPPCSEAEDLVARGLGLALEPPCNAECRRQKSYFYARAAALCPTSATAHGYLGDLYASAGQLMEARDSYRRALAADHDFTPALFGLGDVALLERQYADAIDFYERALALAPADARSACALEVARKLASD